MQRRVLLIGWPGADWKTLLPLVDEGALPNVARLIDNGVIGKLIALPPVNTAASWTSIATGKRAHQHRVLGNHEPLPDGTGVRRATCLCRKAKAVWNILNQNGRRSLLLGWPVSHPAEPIEGVLVTDHFPNQFLMRDASWPILKGAIHPKSLEKSLAELRVHQSEISGLELLPFVPKLAELQEATDKRLEWLASVLAETASIQAVATELVREKNWDFAAVFFDGLRRIGERFAKYTPPRLDSVSNSDFEKYQHVIRSAYKFFDMMLGTLTELVGNETTIVIVSDQGIHSRSHRSSIRIDESDNRLGLEPGMVIMCGPGFKKDALIYGTSVLDIVPTILRYFELPVGRDMDGQILHSALDQSTDSKWVESWDSETGTDAMHSEGLRYDPLAVISSEWDLSQDSKFHDVDLVSDNCNELRFNLAQSFMGAHCEGKAIALLEELWERDPAESKYGYKLMLCYMAINRGEYARRSFERILENKKRCAPIALSAWKKFNARDEHSLSDGERVMKQRLWKQSRINLSGMAFLNGWLLHTEEKHQEALDAVERADESKIYNVIGLLKLKADCLLKLSRHDEAEAMYRRILEFDHENSEAYLGLASLCYDQDRYHEAVDNAASSIRFRYFNPMAHFVYGGAIYRCGKPQKAAEALEVAVKQSPYLIGAYQRLILLYGGPLNDVDKSQFYHDKMERAKRQKELFDLSREQGAETIMEGGV